MDGRLTRRSKPSVRTGQGSFLLAEEEVRLAQSSLVAGLRCWHHGRVAEGASLRTSSGRLQGDDHRRILHESEALSEMWDG